MTPTRKIKVTYVTSSRFKKEENSVFVTSCHLKDSRSVADVFEFEIREVPIAELLEVKLEVMVQAEVVNAYSQIRIPCIVEHAGLIFDNYKDRSYPGGLTKPMWDTLGDDFIKETNSENRRVIARAVVAYCDGKSVKTFVGETVGALAEAPRGNREFYWDTVFVPDEATGAAAGKTYAEIVELPNLGLKYKIEKLSQSSKAMLSFLEYLDKHPNGDLWRC
jgi:inosine/xanthosine triphosphate pyrophosphatase family protein